MGKCTERLYNGIVKENPTFVQMLGMCPTLAVTSSAINGAGMGLTTTCILVLSNFMISALRKVIPDKVRIPSFIVIIASFVTIIQFLLQAYLPSLNSSLGLYIPLIVVNCIILGRAEAYASKNKVLPSIFDGLGMGLGFTVGLTLIGMFRELVGKGCVFGFQILGDGNRLQSSSGIVKGIGNVLSLYTPITIFVLAPGAFFVLAFIIAFINRRNVKKAAEALANGQEIPEACRPDSCAGCINAACCGKLTSEVSVKAVETSAKAAASGDAKQIKKTGDTPSADKKPENTKMDEPRLSPYAPTRESVLADIKLVPNATGKMLKEHAGADKKEDKPEKVQDVEKVSQPVKEQETQPEKQPEKSQAQPESQTEEPQAQPESKPEESQAQPESKPEEPQAQSEKQTEESQVQSEPNDPDGSNQDAKDGKISEEAQNKDSDIKLKETMAHIKKKKGKGGKR